MANDLEAMCLNWMLASSDAGSGAHCAWGTQQGAIGIGCIGAFSSYFSPFPFK
jgi:hypothetical protein